MTRLRLFQNERPGCLILAVRLPPGEDETAFHFIACDRENVTSSRDCGKTKMMD